MEKISEIDFDSEKSEKEPGDEDKEDSNDKDTYATS